MFLAKSNLSCGEASVFALVKPSLDCRHVCLLESALLLAGCCERVFLHHGSIHHYCCPPWTSRSFYVSERTSVFLFLRMYQTVDLAPNVPARSLSDGYVLFLKPNNCLIL